MVTPCSLLPGPWVGGVRREVKKEALKRATGNFFKL
jgi:hypothetical protein